jgi:hypothetical protein
VVDARERIEDAEDGADELAALGGGKAAIRGQLELPNGAVVVQERRRRSKGQAEDEMMGRGQSSGFRRLNRRPNPDNGDKVVGAKPRRVLELLRALGLQAGVCRLIELQQALKHFNWSMIVALNIQNGLIGNNWERTSGFVSGNSVSSTRRRHEVRFLYDLGLLLHCRPP